MKKIFLIISIVALSATAFAQKNKEQKEELTYKASYNGKDHLIQIGDTVHLGYGSSSGGSFMYVGPNSMDKRWAGKTGTVKKVKYIKSMDQYQVWIKGVFGEYIIEVPQAIEKGEVAGFNQTFFK